MTRPSPAQLSASPASALPASASPLTRAALALGGFLAAASYATSRVAAGPTSSVDVLLMRHGRVAARQLGIAAVVAALALPSAVQAQSLDSLAPTTRIRVDVRTLDSVRFAPFGRSRAQPVIGTLAALHGDTVLLAVGPGAAQLRVPRASIHAVYTSRGRPPRWQSALRSAVVPALAGAAFRGLAASIRDREGDPTPARAAVTGAVIGGAFAAAKGALFPKERWQRVTVPTTPAADSLLAHQRAEAARAASPPP